MLAINKAVQIRTIIAPDGTIATKNLRGAGMLRRYEQELERWKHEQARLAASGS